MSTVALHPPTGRQQTAPSPLPQLLQTPSGLALLELQGVINLPGSDPDADLRRAVSIGRLDFPDYHPDAANTVWLKRVYLYVGQHQRLTGEVKKLPNPLAVVRRRGVADGAHASASEEPAEELEVVEIVKYKIVFSQRPEPVGTAL